VTTIRTLCEFKGRLVTTPAGARGGNPNISAHSVVYERTDPTRGGWEPVSDFGFGDPGNKTTFEMCGFGGHLCVGTFNLEGDPVWRSTVEGEKPYHFEGVLTNGAHRGKLNQCVLSMAPFKGALYIGSGIQGGGIDTQNRVGPAPPERVRLWPDGRRDLVVGDERDTPDGPKVPLSGSMPGFNNFFAGAGPRPAPTSSTTSARTPSSTTTRGSTRTAASTARPGCPSPTTAWATRTTWGCARWSPRPAACSSAPPTRTGRRSCRSTAIAA
jgi:hypothetical protein